MSLKPKEREYLKESGVWKDYQLLRDNLKHEHSAADSIQYALYTVTDGLMGCELESDASTPTSPPTHIKPGTLPKPGKPERLDSSFGEIGDDSMLVTVNWVGQNMYVKNVQPDDAPNSAAYGWWVDCQSSASLREDFWTKVLPKLLPSKAVLEAQDRFKDDGQELIDLNRVILKALEASPA